MKARIWLAYIMIAAAGSAAHAIDKDSVIELLADRTIIPIAFETSRGYVPNKARESLTLRATSAFIVKEVRHAAKGPAWLRLQRDVQDIDPHTSDLSPNDIWILESQLNARDFHVGTQSFGTLLSITDAGEEASSADDMWVTLDNGKMISRSVSSYCTLHPTLKFCSSSAVKYKIERHGLVTHRVQGFSSFNFLNSLLNEGWKSVGCDQRANAKPGMVCSYDQEFQGVGYVELWTGKGWYGGYRFLKAPIEASCSRCVIKN